MATVNGKDVAKAAQTVARVAGASGVMFAQLTSGELWLSGSVAGGDGTAYASVPVDGPHAEGAAVLRMPAKAAAKMFGKVGKGTLDVEFADGRLTVGAVTFQSDRDDSDRHEKAQFLSLAALPDGSATHDVATLRTLIGAAGAEGKDSCRLTVLRAVDGSFIATDARRVAAAHAGLPDGQWSAAVVKLAIGGAGKRDSVELATSDGALIVSYPVGDVRVTVVVAGSSAPMLPEAERGGMLSKIVGSVEGADIMELDAKGLAGIVKRARAVATSTHPGVPVRMRADAGVLTVATTNPALGEVAEAVYYRGGLSFDTIAMDPDNLEWLAGMAGDSSAWLTLARNGGQAMPAVWRDGVALASMPMRLPDGQEVMPDVPARPSEDAAVARKTTKRKAPAKGKTKAKAPKVRKEPAMTAQPHTTTTAPKAEPVKAERKRLGKAERKAANRALAAEVRALGLIPNGEVWQRAKRAHAEGKAITAETVAA